MGYLAEAMRITFQRNRRTAGLGLCERVKPRLGAAVRGRDETAVIKTVAGFIEIAASVGRAVRFRNSMNIWSMRLEGRQAA